MPMPPGQESSTRLRAFDLARGVAVVIMVTVHAVLLFGTPALNRSAPARLLIGLGIPTGSAPLFLFVMGATLARSRASLRRGAGRGLWLLALGYGLNLARAVPFALAFRGAPGPPGDVAAYVPTSFGTALWAGDILQCAGLAVILLVLASRVVRHPASWLALAAGVALASPLLWGRMTGWTVADRVLGLVWGTDPHVVFPLFPWMAYVLLGRAVGGWLGSAADPARVLARGARAGAGLVATGAVLAALAPGWQIGTFSRSGPGAVAVLSGIVLLWTAACQAFVVRFPRHRLVGWLTVWGTRVTTLYVVHWVLLAWGLALIGYRRHGWAAVLLLAGAVLALTHQAARAWALRPAPARGFPGAVVQRRADITG